MATVTDEVVIKKVGAIDELHIAIPEEGGVVLCLGPNGTGKDTAIEAVSAGLGRKVDLEKQRGQVASGSIETPWGRKVSVGQKVVGSGKLLVSTVDEDFSFSDIIAPSAKDPVAADKITLKAIIRAGRAKADITRFHKLFASSESFLQWVDSDSVKTDDVVAMASLVKRAIETAAREEESQFERLKGEFDVLKKSLEGVDMETLFDLPDLRSGYELAVTNAANAKNGRKEYLAACARAKELTEKLAEAETSTTITVEDVNREVESLADESLAMERRIKAIGEEIQKLEQQKTELEKVCRSNRERQASLSSKMQLAKKSASEIEGLKSDLDQVSKVPEVTEEAIQAAESTVETLRQQMTNAELQERNRHKQQEMISRRDSGEEHRKTAEMLRTAAKKTESILSEIIAELGTQVRVVLDEKQNPRLVVDHPKWGETYLQDLSVGERVVIAIRVAMKGAGDHGVITMPQQDWESLDPVNQVLIDSELKGSGIVCITGKCDVGELRAEVFAGSR